MIILIIGFTCPPNIHFKFVTSLRQVLLQSAMAVYYKVSQLVYYNVRQVLLQSATILLEIATGITRCDRISSKGWTFFLNNNCNILVKKCENTISEKRRQIDRNTSNFLDELNCYPACYSLSRALEIQRNICSFEQLFFKKIRSVHLKIKLIAFLGSYSASRGYIFAVYELACENVASVCRVLGNGLKRCISSVLKNLKRPPWKVF